MAETLVVDVLGALILLTTVIGFIYGNSLRSAISGSELARVWRFVNLGIFFLFLAALSGLSSYALNIEPQEPTLAFVFLASLSITLGVKLQRDKVK